MTFAVDCGGLGGGRGAVHSCALGRMLASATGLASIGLESSGRPWHRLENTGGWVWVEGQKSVVSKAYLAILLHTQGDSKLYFKDTVSRDRSC